MRLPFAGVLLLSLLAVTAAAQADPSGVRRLEDFRHAEIGTVRLYKDTRSDASAVIFASQMQVNTDGAPDSYHPNNVGITHICNGVSVGSRRAPCRWKADCLADFNRAKAEWFRGATRICFFAMATDEAGVPLVQGASDPRPGYYISTTAFKQPGAPRNSPQEQLDSNELPFVVIPGPWARAAYQGLRLGDFAAVLRRSNGRLAFAVVGDLGPANKLGEGSVRLHGELGNDPFITRRGVRRALRGITAGGRDVVYVLLPGSRLNGTAITREVVEREGRRLLERFGGEGRLRALAREL